MIKATLHAKLASLPLLLGACGIVQSTPDASTDARAEASPRDAGTRPDARRADADARPSDATVPRDAPPAEASVDAVACPAPSLACGAACVDPQSDIHHCGSCAVDCTTLAHIDGASSSCVAGACQFSCAADYANCGDAGGGCTTNLRASATCGSCTTACSGETPVCGEILEDAGAGQVPIDRGIGCVQGCLLEADVRCGGACVDLQSDSDNCGACGNACGGQCVLGRCLVNLAPAALAFQSVTSVAVDSTDVYYIDNRSDGLVHVPLGGGDVVAIALPENDVFPLINLALSPTSIYAASQYGIVVAPLDGGSSRRFPGDAAVSLYGPRELAIGATQLYWIDDYESGDVLAAPFDGGPVTVVLSTPPYVGEIAVGPSAVYADSQVNDAGVILGVAIDGGAISVEPLVQASQLYYAQVLWAAGDLYLSTLTSIMRVPGGQGAPVTVVSGAVGISSFTADATSVYWADSGFILSKPKEGGMVTTLTNQAYVNGLVVDPTSLYWIDGNKQQLVKLTPK